MQITIPTSTPSDLLGSGGWGSVFREVRDGHLTAVKYIDVTDQWVRRMILREVAILQSISHPNVIRLLSFSLSNETANLVLELGGLDLYDIMDRYDPPAEFKRRMFAQLARAILHLHDSHVVHRDIKLENVLVNDDNCVKLIDFNLAHVFSNPHDRTCTDQVGSAAYVAPESFAKPCSYDAYAADVWSLGVVLFSIIARHHPVRHANTSKAKMAGAFQTMGMWPTASFLTLYQKDVREHTTIDERNVMDAMLWVCVAKRSTIQSIVNLPYCAVI